MASRHDYGTWVATEAAKRDVDASVARDMLVECFLQAQKETLEHAKTSLGTTVDDDALRRTARGAVRNAINRSGGCYEDPDRDSIEGAMEVLAAKAKTWGTPDEVISRHMGEMSHVLLRVRN